MAKRDIKLLLVCLCLASLTFGQMTNRVGNTVGTFGLKFFSIVQESPPENYVFSPYSILAAFASILPVSHGQTRSELHSVLGLDVLISQEMTIFNAMHFGPHEKTAQLANGWFVQKGLQLSRTIRKNQALVQEADFAGNPEMARQQVNDFVAEATHGLIADVVPMGSITKSTQLALANGLYFKNTWQKQFDTDLTKIGDFHGLGDKKEQATLMTVENLTLEFKEIPEMGAKAVALPYKGNTYQMLVIVPDQPDDLGALLKQASGSMGFTALVEGYSRTSFSKVVLPKFSIQTSIDALEKPLSIMGLQSMFNSDSTDLNIVEGRDLALDQAVHKALIEVNEEGTMAVAATGFSLVPLIGYSTGGDFIVDRPFMYMLTSLDGNTVVFMGAVVSPGVQQ